MSIRHRLLLSVMMTLFLGLSSAWAADPLKRPEDFRSVRWGTPASSVADLKNVDRDGDIVHYERPTEKKTLGGISLQHVTYSFYKDQFYHAEIDYEGEGSFEALQKSLEAKYGPPDAVRQKTDPAGHPYEVAVWNWPGYAFIGNRHDKDTHHGRIFYFYAPLTDASAKAQGIAPTKKAKGVAATGAPATGGYHVNKGDSLGRIAKHLGVTEKDIAAANPGLTDKTLKAGATINLPAGAKDTTPPLSDTPAVKSDSTPADNEAAGSREQTRETAKTPAKQEGASKYTVKDGDILSKVAQRHGVTTSAIIAANPGINPDALRLGTVLTIPAKK